MKLTAVQSEVCTLSAQAVENTMKNSTVGPRVGAMDSAVVYEAGAGVSVATCGFMGFQAVCAFVFGEVALSTPSVAVGI